MTYRPPFTHAGSDAGQAVVELALVFLVLMTLVFGGLEFGRAVNAWAIVTSASREGARTAAALCTLNPACSTSVQTSVDSALTGLDVATARWTMDGGPYVAGGPVMVHVEYDVAPLTPLIAAFVPGGAFTVSGETTMRLE